MHYWQCKSRPGSLLPRMVLVVISSGDGMILAVKSDRPSLQHVLQQGESYAATATLPGSYARADASTLVTVNNNNMCSNITGMFLAIDPQAGSIEKACSHFEK